MKISILHPSFNRPELARKCYDSWMSKCDNPQDIEYILCLSDNDNIQAYKPYFNMPECKVVVTSAKGLVKSVNHAAKLSSGNLLIAISDDFDCPEHWDALLLNAIDGKSDYLVKTNDGTEPWIITLPIMDRVYYEARGYIYHPDSVHMFCDTWITHEGHLMGKVIDLPLLFPHNHYSTGKVKKDAVNVANDSTWEQGKQIYFNGVKNNFGIANPVKYTLPESQHNWLRANGVIQ